MAVSNRNPLFQRSIFRCELLVLLRVMVFVKKIMGFYWNHSHKCAAVRLVNQSYHVYLYIPNSPMSLASRGFGGRFFKLLMTPPRDEELISILKKGCKFSVVVSTSIYFHPEPWGNDPIWQTFFSDGLKPPASYDDCCSLILELAVFLGIQMYT